MSAYTINFDGACELDPATGQRNPGGIATFGWIIQDISGNRLAYGYGEAGRGNNQASNNIGEFTALIKALDAFLSLGLASELIKIRGDSQLVVNQVNGAWQCKSPHLRVLKAKVTGLLDQLPQVLVQWVPRELNQEADDLSKKAYGEAVKMPPDAEPWEKRFRTKVLVLSEAKV